MHRPASNKAPSGVRLTVACNCGASVVVERGMEPLACTVCGTVYEWRDGCESCGGCTKPGSNGKTVCGRCGVRVDCCG